MVKALNPRDDVDRLYEPRGEGSRRLASIDDCVEASIQRLEDYIEKRGGRLITATRNNTNDMRKQNDNNKKTKVGRKTTLQTFKRLKSDISSEKTWT